jgi:benzoyl-CoA reductase/2-hydroxyglutaryl-CoA dehydratase subunit BcrC/BadD/HgdB
MEAQTSTQSQDKGRLIALQGNLKDLPLEDVLRQVYSHLLSENEHKRERIEELIDRLKQLEEQTKKKRQKKY